MRAPAGSALSREVPRARVAAGSDSAAMLQLLYAVKPLGIFKYLRTQPPSFWLVCFYLFMEYVRPQSIYTQIDILPWGQLSLLCAIAAFFMEGNKIGLRTPADGWLGVFTLTVLVSSIFAYSPATSFNALELFISWLIVYLLISNIVVTEARFLVFLLSFLLYSLKMSQHGLQGWALAGFGFQSWGVAGAPGWFHNSGEFGVQMDVFMPMSLFFFLALKAHWGKLKQLFFLFLPISACIGMIASSSRGSLVGGAAVALWLAMKSKYKFRAAVGLAITAIIVLMLIPPEFMLRLQAMGQDSDSVVRTTMWKRGLVMASENPLFGIGYFNWSPYSLETAGSALLPHNIFIQAVAELGYPGLLAFVGLIICTFVINARTRRLAGKSPENRFLHYSAQGLDGALVGYLVSGFFVTVLYYPYFWINLAMTVGLHRAMLHKARAAVQAPRAGPETPGRPIPMRGVQPVTLPRTR